MENDFYKVFKRIIRECSYDNTYKMAWAKALVEIAIEKQYNNDIVIIQLEEIALKYIKYYWNQTIFFDLIQGSNLVKIPIILQYVKGLIEKYYNFTKRRKPERFEKIEEILKNDLSQEYQTCIKKVSFALKEDVSWRFTYIAGKNYSEIYEYTKGKNQIKILGKNLKILKENCDDLFDFINYKWGFILETFNSAPRINRKVKIIDEQEIRRSSLSKFKKFLDLENQERKCFICGNIIENSQLSIDHVIPWSYLYSDDLWNLVYVHKSCNASKSNVIPQPKDIERLKLRNLRLSEILSDKNKKGKMIDELNLAIEKDYVTKFWIGCKS